MRRTVRHGAYIWQRKDWPEFRWDSKALLEPLSRLSQLHGLLNGRMSMLGFNEKCRSLLSAMTEELISSSEIEGVLLNPNSVRSSIARRLGIEDDGLLVEDHYVEGLVILRGKSNSLSLQWYFIFNRTLSQIMAKGKKTGGRVKGTPNKENPLKGYIRSHSMDYFEPRPRKNEETGQEIIASQFELDIAALAPDDRVAAELRLLKFHMPEMKAIDMDMTVGEAAKTIEERLAELAGEDEDE